MSAPYARLPGSSAHICFIRRYCFAPITRIPAKRRPRQTAAWTQGAGADLAEYAILSGDGMHSPSAGVPTMSNGSTLSLPELENRIAILRDNIRQLVEQAAGSSGAGDEDR